MEKTYDLPSGDRIWELARKAMEIEKEANQSCSLSYELFESIVNTEADRAMARMDPAEQRFFATCFQGVYVAPEQRGEDWQSEYEIRQELRRELYGDEQEVDMDPYDTEERQAERERQNLRIEQDLVELPEQDEDLRFVMLPDDLADPEKRAEFWQTHSDPVQETLVSLLPENEEVRRVFIMERNVLPARRTEFSDIQQTVYGPFQARGEIEYDLVAKVSAAGTRWAIAAQHYDWDDFADRGPRLVEIVHSFDSLEEAKAWLPSYRALVTPELPDSRKELEHIVASVISTPEFEEALMEQGYSLSTFQRNWSKYGSFMDLPQDYRAAINWAEHEIKAGTRDQTMEVEMER
jgi:hypothetical protein